VSLPLLRKERPGAMYYLYDVGAPAQAMVADAPKAMSIG